MTIMIKSLASTYLLEIGIPIEEVSAWLRHSSIATTARIYAHINIGIRQNAAITMDKLLGYREQTQNKAENKKVLSNLFENLLADIKNSLISK